MPKAASSLVSTQPRLAGSDARAKPYSATGNKPRAPNDTKIQQASSRQLDQGATSHTTRPAAGRKPANALADGTATERIRKKVRLAGTFNMPSTRNESSDGTTSGSIAADQTWWSPETSTESITLNRSTPNSAPFSEPRWTPYRRNEQPSEHHDEMSLDPFDTEAGLRTEDQSMESLDTIIRDGESPQLEVGNISLDAPRQDLLNSIFNGPNRFPDVPPAFDEDPIIRDVYIDVFLAASFDHVSRAEAQRMLSSANRTLVAMSKRFGNELRGLGEMARTLPDVQRRLGFDSGQHVVYYFVCDICWSRYHPSQLYRLETSECTQPGCSGVLFVTKESGGRTDRIPVKVLPVASQLES